MNQKSKFNDKILLLIEQSSKKQNQLRKKLRVRNTGISLPLELTRFFNDYWPITILENIVSIRGRIGYHGLTRADYRDTGPILLSVGNISKDGRLNFKKTTHIHDKSFKRSPSIIVEKNDILLSKSGTIGRVGLVEESNQEMTINAAINIFRCGDIILPKYLFYWFRSPTTQTLLDSLAPGIAQRNLFQRELRRLSIPIPTLDFQQNLINKIEEIFAIIDLNMQNITKVIHQISIYRLSLLDSSFMIDSTKQALLDCGEIGTGGTPSRSKPEYYGNKFPWVKTAEVKNNIIYETGECITQLGLDNSNARIYPKNSVILAMYGEGKTRGRCSILDIPASTNQACAVIVCKPEKLFFKYCFYWLQSQYHQVRRKSSGGNQPNLNLGTVKKFEIPLPDIPTQEKIVGNIEIGLSQIDNLTEKSNLIMLNIQNLKNSILKQIFEGKLIPQDPNDEPAQILLEKIKSNKESRPTKQMRSKNVK